MSAPRNANEPGWCDAWERQEKLLDAFEDAWQSGQPPTIDAYLPTGPDRLTVLVELVSVDLEFRLQRGESLPVESYWARYPELSQGRPALELIAWEFELRRRVAIGVTIEEYLTRFPQFAKELPARLRHIEDRDVSTDTPRQGLAETLQLGDDTTPQPAVGWPTIPGYEILGELGRGGMGVVYKARHLALKRLVALKMVLSQQLASPEDLTRFRAEAEAIARLQHPNIVQVHEIGTHAGLPFIALEYVAGGSLADQLKGTPLPSRDAAQLVATLAQTMHYAHHQGIIHRDLKPGNVLLAGPEKRMAEDEASRPPPFSHQPKITDFGLAKQLDSDLGQTRTGTPLGTPSYMAPEQAVGRTRDIGPATDVYALGAILYELLAGRPPFKAATVLETLEQVQWEDPLPPSRLQTKVPHDLETICLKCLEKSPAKRYPTAAGLADDLQRFLRGEPILARPAGWLEQAAKWAKRRPVWAALMVVSVLAAIGLSTLSAKLWFTVNDLDLMVTKANEETGRAQANEAASNERLHVAEVRRLLDMWHRGSVAAMKPLFARYEEHPDKFDLETFEWGLLRQFLQRTERGILRGHTGEVFCIVYSPDGRLLASGGQDGTIRLWDPAREALIAAIPAGGRVRALAFLPNGRTLAGLLGDPNEKRNPTTDATLGVRFWDLDSREQIPLPPIAEEDRQQPHCVALSHDGQLVAAGLRDKSIKVWETTTGNLHMQTDSGHLPADDIWFTEDGERLVYSSGDLALMELRTERRIVQPPIGPPALAAGSSRNGLLWATAKPKGGVHIHQTTGEHHTAYGGGVDSGQYGGEIGLTRSIAFRPDARFMAIGANDGTIRLWDFRNRGHVRTLKGHTDGVWSVTFAPDGQTIASGSADGTVRLWPQSDFDDARHLVCPLQYQPWTNLPTANDGRTLAVACRDQRVRLVDLKTMTVKRVLEGSKADLRQIDLTRNGRYVAAARHDKTLEVWEADTGKLLMTLPTPRVPYCVGLAQDGTEVAAGFADGLRRWRVPTGEPLASPAGTYRGMHALLYTPDAKTLICTSDDAKVRFWNTATMQEAAPPFDMPHPNGRVLSLTRDGRYLATMVAGTREVCFWDLSTRKLLPGFPRRFHESDAVTTSPDGKMLFTGIEVIDAASKQTLRRVNGMHEIQAMSVTPDGKFHITGGKEGGVKFWNWASGGVRNPEGQGLRAVRSLGFSRDGRALFTASRNLPGPVWIKYSRLPFTNKEVVEHYSLWEADDLRLWSVATGEELPELPRQPMPGALALWLTQDRVLVGSRGGMVWQWDLHTRQPLGKFFADNETNTYWNFNDFTKISPISTNPEYSHNMTALAVTPDGATFATTADNGKVTIWDTTTGQVKRTLPVMHDQAATTAFAPDGVTLAVNHGSLIHFWDVATGTKTRTLAGHREVVHCLAFSPNGRYLASGGPDRAIHLTNLTSFETRVLIGHTDTVTSLAFTPDGKTLASGSWDSNVRLWHVRTAQELMSLEGHHGRVFCVAFSPDGHTLASGGEHPDGSGEVRLWDAVANRRSQLGAAEQR